MTTYSQELEDSFQMTLSEILASDLLDDDDDRTTPQPNSELNDIERNSELSDRELLSIRYMYEIDKQDHKIYIFDQNYTLRSIHIFLDPKIVLRDELALELINLEKQHG